MRRRDCGALPRSPEFNALEDSGGGKKRRPRRCLRHGPPPYVLPRDARVALLRSPVLLEAKMMIARGNAEVQERLLALDVQKGGRKRD